MSPLLLPSPQLFQAHPHSHDFFLFLQSFCRFSTEFGLLVAFKLFFFFWLSPPSPSPIVNPHSSSNLLKTDLVAKSSRPSTLKGVETFSLDGSCWRPLTCRLITISINTSGSRSGFGHHRTSCDGLRLTVVLWQGFPVNQSVETRN